MITIYVLRAFGGVLMLTYMAPEPFNATIPGTTFNATIPGTTFNATLP